MGVWRHWIMRLSAPRGPHLSMEQYDPCADLGAAVPRAHEGTSTAAWHSWERQRNKLIIIDAWDDKNRWLREDCAQEYGENVTHRRLAAIVLLMVLLGANTAVASVCEAYCAVEKKGHHHHQTEMTVSSPHHHPHAQHHMAGCPACPKSAGLPSPHPRDCANEVQALREPLSTLSSDREVLQLEITRSSTGSLQAPIERERFSPFHSPPKISSFEPILVSLRI
jgi:hypothetical protein